MTQLYVSSIKLQLFIIKIIQSVTKCINWKKSERLSMIQRKAPSFTNINASKPPDKHLFRNKLRRE